jgi:hypothetical protein
VGVDGEGRLSNRRAHFIHCPDSTTASAEKRREGAMEVRTARDA